MPRALISPELRTQAGAALAISAGALLAVLGGYGAGHLALDSRHLIILVVAVVATFVLGVLFFYARETLLLLIILFRSDLDRMLEMTKVGIGSSGMSLGGLLNALIIGLLVMELLHRKRILAGRLLLRTWLPLLLVMTLTLLYTPRLVPGIKNDLALMSYAAIFLLAFVYVRDKASHDRWLWAVLLSSLGPVLYGLYQLLTHSGYQAPAYEGAGLRISSSFTNSNIFAFYLVLMVSMLFVVWRGGLLTVGPRLRRLLPLYILLLLVLLLATKTRSAWGAMAIFFFAYTLIMERKLFPLLVIAAGATLLLPEVRERITELTSGNSGMYYQPLNSFAWRKEMWWDALRFMEPAHYLYGYGKESFEFYSAIFFSHADGALGPPAHNVYMQVFFDGGVLGLGAFVWLLVSTGAMARRVMKTDRMAGFLLLMLVIELAVVSYSDNMLDYLVFQWYLWFALGAGFSLHRVRQFGNGEP